MVFWHQLAGVVESGPHASFGIFIVRVVFSLESSSRVFFSILGRLFHLESLNTPSHLHSSRDLPVTG